jgi:CheY-like chemotaxis protein
MSVSTSPVSVLLVEDDEIDIEAVLRSFRKLRIANPVTIAKDGLQALDILRGTNGATKITPPYLIILDLNMPRMNGHEFLAEIRNDPELKSSIVFVLTTSNDDKDRLDSYEMNVAGYMLKGKVGQSFLDAIGLLDHYWRVVEFPH